MENFLATFLVLSVGFDFKDRKIPNELILVGYLVGGIYRICDADGGIGLWMFLRDALIPIALLFILFKIRALGAGDIKIYSVVAGIAGVDVFFQILVTSFFVGAVAAVVKMTIHREIDIAFRAAGAYIKEVLEGKSIKKYPVERRTNRNTIHFAAAIAAGYLLVLGRSCLD